MFEGERSLLNKGIPDTDSAFYQETVANMFPDTLLCVKGSSMPEKRHICSLTCKAPRGTIVPKLHVMWFAKLPDS